MNQIGTAKQELILIVDDNPTNIQVLSDLLKEYGFKVLVAKDGESCLHRLEKIRPDLILLDVLMPGIDGFETCRRLKASPATKEIPVIFMTALADPVDKLKGLTIGAVDYITKPLQHEEAIARVNIHLQLRNLNKQLEEQNATLQQEIRSRKLAESALRLSEEKFAKAFRSSPIPITISTLSEGRFIEVNESFCTLTGFSQSEIIGHTSTALNLWVNSDNRIEIIQLLREKGVVRNRELDYRTKSGEIRTVLFSAEIINYGGQDCLLAIPNDITERKQDKKAIAQADREIKRLTTLDGITQIANRRRFEEYLGQQWRKLVLEPSSLSLILCKLENFQHYNNIYGYAAANEFLRTIAQVITRAMDNSDNLAARYDSEEFAVILPNTKDSEAIELANTIREEIQKLIHHSQLETSQPITLTIGTASIIPNGNSSPSESLIIPAKALK
ncbi:MAG: diguanylate cyclase [Xenococcaceae cyanobacterium MO_188.B32]|nr:diguanylate cyclase [Xenococcaceae cyanobacterium MO_188.B32]